MIVVALFKVNRTNSCDDLYGFHLRVIIPGNARHDEWGVSVCPFKMFSIILTLNRMNHNTTLHMAHVYVTMYYTAAGIGDDGCSAAIIYTVGQ